MREYNNSCTITIYNYHLFGHSAQLYSNISSRVPNANHNYPLPSPIFWVFVVAAVEELPLKRVYSCNAMYSLST